VKKPILEGSPDETLAFGTKIDGFLEQDVQYLKEKSKDDKELIHNVINLWLWKKEDHIEDLMAVLQSNEKRRIVSNKSGMNKTKTMGAGVSIPTTLLIALEKCIPNIVDDKKQLNKFKKWFPQFKTY